MWTPPRGCRPVVIAGAGQQQQPGDQLLFSISAVVAVAAVVTASVPTAIEVATAVTDTLLLTTTQPITPDGAAANPLAGTAVGSQGGIVVPLLVALVVVGNLVSQRRQSRPSR